MAARLEGRRMTRMIDLQKLADVLNKHVVECYFAKGWGAGDARDCIVFSELPCNLYGVNDVEDAPATTLIREALVRDGLQVTHYAYPAGEHAVDIDRDDRLQSSHHKDTYTEALLAVALEVWR